MKNTFKITRGLDIPLKGKATLEVVSVSPTGIWSLTPGDYYGVVPRLIARVGDQVKAGTPLFFDKNRPEIQFVAPVSGTISDILRGEKRKLLNILIQAESSTEFLAFPVRKPLEMTSAAVQKTLLESGLWTLLKQRPYDLIADPQKTPRAIFVTGFDSSPLAPDYEFLLKDRGSDFQTGLDALTRLTEGKVYLGLPEKGQSSELNQAARVEIRRFDGPHPAGLVGVQINKMAPINKGEVVFTTNALDVLIIGSFFNQGKVDLTRTVAITGPEVRNPHYIRCKPGIPLKVLLEGNVYKEIPLRFINGNALTGVQTDSGGYLSAYSHQLTVLHEGSDIHELLGWAMPRLNMFSNSGTYFTSLMRRFFPGKTYEPDTRILGGERALIMSGEYDKVFPMDILPEQLVRSCISGNLEKQENLGLYEVAPEDFALCEYVCTSKINVQQVIRQALDILKLENGD